MSDSAVQFLIEFALVQCAVWPFIGLWFWRIYRREEAERQASSDESDEDWMRRFGDGARCEYDLFRLDEEFPIQRPWRRT